jgi:hypothetical protein
VAASGPSPSDFKALFARSGNRCAFPKCKASVVGGDTILGQICHIKGDKPGSARHDPNQTPEQRHARENLILLCPNHHAVIDADEEAYTVERLKKMKAEHEATATAVPDEVTERAAQVFVTQTVSTVGQSGGIAANTIHNVNVGTTPGALSYSNIPLPLPSS